MKNEYRTELRQLCRERREILARLFEVQPHTATWDGLFSKLTEINSRLSIVRFNYDFTEQYNDMVLATRFSRIFLVLFGIMFAGYILLKDLGLI
jgi:hypothetical protein